LNESLFFKPGVKSRSNITHQGLFRSTKRRFPAQASKFPLVNWLVVCGWILTAATSQAQTFTSLKSFGIFTNITGFNPESTLAVGPDGTLYGNAPNGEGPVAGTVFKIQPDGSQFTVLKWFTNSFEGANPQGGLTLSGNVLYGTTLFGGSSNYGTIFKLNTDGSGFAVLKNFSGADGKNPLSVLTVSGGVIYGTTFFGGTLNLGTVFKMNLNGTGYTLLKSFSVADGSRPRTGLALSGGVLFGTTYFDGTLGAGNVFKINTDGTGYAFLKSFEDNNNDGASPEGTLVFSGGELYGTTVFGGSSNNGTVFALNAVLTNYTVLKTFTGSDGKNPNAGLVLSGNVLYGMTAGGGSSSNGTVFAITTGGTNFTVLTDFTGGEGAVPDAGLALSGGVLFGTTTSGGSAGLGTVFAVNTNGTSYSVLENFTYSDGAEPGGVLTLCGGVLYGTTTSDGSYGNGTLFALNTDGTGYTVLRNFAGSDGANPYAGLAFSNGVLYGTTEAGGSAGAGTVFKVNTNGTGFAVLKEFDPGNSDGVNPFAGLTLSGGVLYGTTEAGGNAGAGTVFRMKTDGLGYTVLKNFDFNDADGASPLADLALSGGVLYGTTSEGGGSGNGTVFAVNTNGTGYTVLKDFNGNDGANPNAVMLSGGVLYGTTSTGGTSNNGTLFRLGINEMDCTVLKNFDLNNNDGAYPSGNLILFNGVLYGTTDSGGSLGSGTVFAVNTNGTAYTVLKNFDSNNNDGQNPDGGLLLSGGVLYGTAFFGGSLNEGTVFNINLGLSVPLSIRLVGNTVVLCWISPGFALQSAPAVTGIFTNIPGAISPYTNDITATQKFFRLFGN